MFIILLGNWGLLLDKQFMMAKGRIRANLSALKVQ